MSKEIRELEENSKRIIENMRPQTIAQYHIKQELNDMREDWKPEKEPNMDEEIELIKKWVKEREDFINE